MGEPKMILNNAFVQQLDDYIKINYIGILQGADKGKTDVEAYKKAGIDRRLFSKIRSNPAYHPRKNTVLALAIALHLDINETKDLLTRAEYAFSPSNKGDLIVKYFIEHQVYDLIAINFALEEYGQTIIEG